MILQNSEIFAALFDDSHNHMFQIDHHYLRECGYIIFIWKYTTVEVSFHGKYGNLLHPKLTA